MALKAGEKKMIGMLAVVGVGVVTWLYVMPMYDEHEKRLAEIDNLVKELRTAHKKAENMSGLSGEVDLLKYKLAELKKVLPSEEGSFEVIEKIQGVAARTGVQIKQITLEERKERGEGWKAEGIRIVFTGYWFQYIEFLWKIENYDRLIDVISVTMVPTPLEAGAKLQTITFDMSANIYSSTLSES